jgi:tetraacyldisaccharide 4'-kinase
MKRARLLLIPVSLLYWLIVAVRNWFFEKGILKITKVGVPVISIGNISTGGVGKTPIVEMLLERLKGKYTLSVVSRGYGRKTTGTIVANDGHGKIASAEEVGDEPSQIARKYPDVIVVVDEKRSRGAQRAVDLGAELILLDDGFQHRYLYRDVDIVITTTREILKSDWLLPAGNRRESIGSLKRSDAIFISRCSNLSEYDQVYAKSKNFNKPVVGVQTKLRSFKPAISNQQSTSMDITGKKAIVFSGIGDPKSFDDLLADADVNVVKSLKYPDHHWYSDYDIRTIVAMKKELNADCIITTEKDVSRLIDRQTEFLKNEQVIVAEICQKVIAGEEQLDEILNKCTKEKQHTDN